DELQKTLGPLPTSGNRQFRIAGTRCEAGRGETAGDDWMVGGGRVLARPPSSTVLDCPKLVVLAAELRTGGRVPSGGWLWRRSRSRRRLFRRCFPLRSCLLGRFRGSLFGGLFRRLLSRRSHCLFLFARRGGLFLARFLLCLRLLCHDRSSR